MADLTRVRKSAQSIPAIFFPFILFAILMAPPCLSYEWEIEVVDVGKQFMWMSNRSIDVDLDGHPHIVYGGRAFSVGCYGLYYAWHDGETWHTELLIPGAGSHLEYVFQPCIDVDAEGHPHVVCASDDFSNGILQYAHETAIGWVMETVETGYIGGWVALGLDQNGQPHICFTDSDWRLYYTYKDPSGWHSEIVNDSYFNKSPSIIIDSYGNPHIAYSYHHYDSLDQVCYSTKGALGWYTEVVLEGGAAWCYGTSIELDHDNRPLISFAHDDSLWIACRTDSMWLVTPIAYAQETGVYKATSLRLDDQGNAHISYGGAQGLSYARQDETGWHISEFDNSIGIYSSICLDADGHPHIADFEVYPQNGRPKRLIYTHEDDSGWHSDAVDTSRVPGLWCSLAVGSDGEPRISHSELCDQWWVDCKSRGSIVRNLLFARRDESGWFIEPVDTTEPGIGKHISLQLDGDDNPHIGYVKDDCYYSEDHRLKYATKQGSGWVTETVCMEDGVFKPEQPSLSVTSDGHPMISYCFGNIIHGSYFVPKDLRRAWRDDLGWSIEIVDSSGCVGSENSLTLDTSDAPHISYYDYHNDDLKYARWDESGWIIETVAMEEGTSTSLALDSAGHPCIAYCEEESYMNEDLKYAYDSGTGWLIDVVDSSGARDVSLALDAADYPYIAYCQGTYVKYAWRTLTGWIVTAVDSTEGGFPEFSSLAIDEQGNIHICYFDGGGCALKYARMVGVPVMDDLVWPPGIELVEIWPNPSSGILFSRIVDPSALTGTRFYLVDIAGRSVAELYASVPGDRNNTSITFRIPDAVSNGIYLLRAVNPETSRMIPVTIIR